MRLLIILILITQTAVNCFSQEEQFIFVDGSKISAARSNSPREKSNFTGRFVEKEMIANYRGLGKALSFLNVEAFLDKSDITFTKKLTKKQNAFLFKELGKINTAFNLEQGGNKFYISTLDSVDDDQLLDCDDCKVKVKVMFLESKSKQKTFVTPIIESIEKISAGKPREISFNDGSSQLVIPFYYQTGNLETIEVTEKEFDATFVYEDTASTVFKGKLVREVSRTNSQLARRTHLTSLSINEGKNLVISSLPLNLKRNARPKSGDKVKCKAFLIKIVADGIENNVLVVKSITRLDVKQISITPTRN